MGKRYLLKMYKTLCMRYLASGDKTLFITGSLCYSDNLLQASENHYHHRFYIRMCYIALEKVHSALVVSSVIKTDVILLC